MTLFESNVFTPREQSKNIFTPRNEELDIQIDYSKGNKLRKKKQSSPLARLNNQAMTSRKSKNLRNS